MKGSASICGPLCWGILGLIGLIGLILGLLFGLGVIGGVKGTGDLNAGGVNAGAETGTVIDGVKYSDNSVTV